MYSFIDQPIDRLRPGSHFILWAMRGWVVSANQNRCPTITLAFSFSRMEMIPVLDEFHRLMLGFHKSGLRCMAFAPPDEAPIKEIEAILLALWADIVAERHERARAVLSLVIAESRVDQQLAQMTRIAAHMASVGLAPAGLAHADQPASRNSRSAD